LELLELELLIKVMMAVNLLVLAGRVAAAEVVLVQLVEMELELVFQVEKMAVLAALV
jgi:hypothetical protein